MSGRGKTDVKDKPQALQVEPREGLHSSAWATQQPWIGTR